jgi:hypothetical protein
LVDVITHAQRGSGVDVRDGLRERDVEHLAGARVVPEVRRGASLDAHEDGEGHGRDEEDRQHADHHKDRRAAARTTRRKPRTETGDG